MILIALRQLELYRTHPAHALCIYIIRVYFRICSRGGICTVADFKRGQIQIQLGQPHIK